MQEFELSRGARFEDRLVGAIESRVATVLVPLNPGFREDWVHGMVGTARAEGRVYPWQTRALVLLDKTERQAINDQVVGGIVDFNRRKRNLLSQLRRDMEQVRMRDMKGRYYV